MGNCFVDDVPPRPVLPDFGPDLPSPPVGGPGIAAPGRFPRRSWAPDIMGFAILGQFAAQPWQKQIEVAPPPAASSPEFASEIAALRAFAASERRKRQAEIVAQDRGYAEYLMRIAMMTEHSHPATYDMVKAAARVGETMMAYHKLKHLRPRPQQYAPDLMPAVSSQAHPSYPSGHATIARLIARAICDVAPKYLHPALIAMADRIGENREVAGLHFRSDTLAGQKLADRAHGVLLACEGYQALMREAAAEWG